MVRSTWVSRCSIGLTKRADDNRGLPGATIDAAITIYTHNRNLYKLTQTKKPCPASAMTELKAFYKNQLRNQEGTRFVMANCHRPDSGAIYSRL